MRRNKTPEGIDYKLASARLEDGLPRDGSQALVTFTDWDGTEYQARYHGREGTLAWREDEWAYVDVPWHRIHLVDPPTGRECTFCVPADRLRRTE